MTIKVITVLMETFSLNSSKKTAKYQNNCFTLHTLKKKTFLPKLKQNTWIRKQTNQCYVNNHFSPIKGSEDEGI